MSQFIDDDPVKVDSPSESRSAPTLESNPEAKVETAVTSPSPERKPEIKVQTEELKVKKITLPAKPTTTVIPPQPAKTGSKRKLAARDDMENLKPQRVTNENLPPRSVTDKQSIREKAGGRTLKELASIRKEAREKGVSATNTRKPLAAKSTNDDISSPKKSSKPIVMDEVAAAKADLYRSKASQERPKAKSKTPNSITIHAVPDIQPLAPTVIPIPCEVGTPLAEAALLSPSSPEPELANDGSRGATPPPAAISSTRETARPSRRNRTAVSYAEPNLRDKMRRPTKELFDAVAGEGRYARRSSQVDPVAPDSVKVKHETDSGESWKTLPLAKAPSMESALENDPASPLAGKGPPELLPSTVVTDRRRRASPLANEDTENNEHGKEMDAKDEVVIPNTSSSDIDVYEFNTSSPQAERQELKRKPSGRKGPRRMSAAVQNEEGLANKERTSSRRRSMMI